MTIERLQIIDFQKHERLDIRLDPGITAITGPSDVGKSTILRALRWIAINKPLGDGFIRHGAKRTTAKVLVDGQTVRRRRGGGENTYKLDDREFKAFGNDVPDPVARVLNLTEVNFQDQHDPPFWFCLTPGEVARQLNRIVDLEVVDEAMSRLAASTRALKAEAEVVGNRLVEARRRRTELTYVTALDQELGRVETLERDWQGVETLREALWARVVAAKGHRDRLGISRRVLGKGRTAATSGQGAVLAGKRMATLSSLLGDARRAKGRAAVAVPDLSDLDRQICQVKGIIERSGALKAIIGQVDQAATRLRSARKETKEAARAFREETGGLCPICGGSLK